MKKVKTYILTVSKNFPVTHKRKGNPTNFPEHILDGTKIHTIRAKYDTWKKRVDEVIKGEAIIKVVNWSAKPYNSKQEEIIIFDKDSGIGVQDLYFDCNMLSESNVSNETSKNGTQTYVSSYVLSQNDGLSLADFQEWFKNYDLSEPMAIIHFTPFRY